MNLPRPHRYKCVAERNYTLSICGSAVLAGAAFPFSIPASPFRRARDDARVVAEQEVVFVEQVAYKIAQLIAVHALNLRLPVPAIFDRGFLLRSEVSNAVVSVSLSTSRTATASTMG